MCLVFKNGSANILTKGIGSNNSATFLTLGVKPVRLFLAVLFRQVSKTDQTLNKSCEQITKNEKKNANETRK